MISEFDESNGGRLYLINGTLFFNKNNSTSVLFNKDGDFIHSKKQEIIDCPCCSDCAYYKGDFKNESFHGKGIYGSSINDDFHFDYSGEFSYNKFINGEINFYINNHRYSINGNFKNITNNG